jgi:hypothetical protein
MKWFFKWLYDGLQKVETQTREEDVYSSPLVARPRTNFNNLKVGLAKATSKDNHLIHLSQSAMNFRLYPATGGHIVEYSIMMRRQTRTHKHFT